MPRRKQSKVEGAANKESSPASPLAVRGEVVDAKPVPPAGPEFDGSIDSAKAVMRKKQASLGGRSIAQQMELILVNAMKGMEERAEKEGLGFADLAVLKVAAPYVMGNATDETLKVENTNYVTIMNNVENAAEDQQLRKQVANLLLDKGDK